MMNVDFGYIPWSTYIRKGEKVVSKPHVRIGVIGRVAESSAMLGLTVVPTDRHFRVSKESAEFARRSLAAAVEGFPRDPMDVTVRFDPRKGKGSIPDWWR